MRPIDYNGHVPDDREPTYEDLMKLLNEIRDLLNAYLVIEGIAA